MAVGREMPKESLSLSRILTTDFCPWANKFVYWLKEPVGWFVLATFLSAIIGMYFAPIGWTMAAALVAMITVGMIWPWIAVRSACCALHPEQEQVHEEAPCLLNLSIRNRLPLPIWGLAVEGFLDRTSEDSEEAALPTVALAYLRGLSLSKYSFAISPSLRGRYPDGLPALTCSFPFGIWTARRTFSDIKPITVWPKVYAIAGEPEMSGQHRAERGEGSRPGRSGDFIGVREYRRGDTAKQVNWSASARAGSLIVTQRGGPECPSVDVIVDTSGDHSRDEIRDRIRVAASLLSSLHGAAIPIRLRLNCQTVSPRLGWDGFVQMMDALTDIPLDGDSTAKTPHPARGTATILVESDDLGNPVVTSVNPTVSHRLSCEHEIHVLDRTSDLATQLETFWTEVRDANLVA
ncbi:MAG: DUF58 domain-containing protein [Planctomycetota bacterium]